MPGHQHDEADRESQASMAVPDGEQIDPLPAEAEAVSLSLDLAAKQRPFVERLASFGLGDAQDPLLTSSPLRRPRKRGRL